MARAPRMLRALRRVLVAAIERPDDHTVRVRSLGGLFTAGGLLAYSSLLVAGDEIGRPWVVIALATTAVVSGLGMIVAGGRVPAVLMGPSLAFGTLLISLAVFGAGHRSDIYAFIYVWVAIDTYYFLQGRAAFLELLWLSGAATAVTINGDLRSDQLLMVVGTCLFAAAFVGIQQSQMRRLVERLNHAARTDWLTRVLNRRGLQAALDAELARSDRRPGAVALLILDVDHFKALNDARGHAAGDQILRALGALLTRTKREIDAAGRLGGEEFALVLPDTDQHGGYQAAERLRAAVRNDPELGAVATTISVGVASYPAHASTADELLRAADHAMYVAKHLGRNRTVVFSAGVESHTHGADDGARAPEHLAAVMVLAEALDLRDGDTAAHARTVGRYAALTAVELGLDAQRVERVRAAGHLHDVGKIGIADPILRKPGALTDEEWAEMRKHPEIGARIVAGANLEDISAWVLAHHERPDGRGYPHGLSGDEIPIEALILSVADAYEAMTADRCYRAALGHDKAQAELLRCAGSQFDPRVVEAFLRGLGRDQAAPSVVPQSAAAAG